MVSTKAQRERERERERELYLERRDVHRLLDQNSTLVSISTLKEKERERERERESFIVWNAETLEQNSTLVSISIFQSEPDFWRERAREGGGDEEESLFKAKKRLIRGTQVATRRRQRERGHIWDICHMWDTHPKETERERVSYERYSISEFAISYLRLGDSVCSWQWALPWPCNDGAPLLHATRGQVSQRPLPGANRQISAMR